MINLQGGRESGSTNTCSNHISGDVCTDRPGSMGETHYHIGLRSADTGTGIRTGNAQYERSAGDFELRQLFHKSFLVHGGTVRRGFQWYQLGDHRVRSRNDDHGRGNGPGGILPLAVHAPCQDSITVILFLAAVTIELSQLLKFNPVPMILAEVFCANLGGSATMCGDPPNIIIGTSLGYSFTDFLTNTGVIAGVSLVVVVLYFYLVFHKELRASEAAAAGSNQTYPDPSEAITDKKGFIISTIIFLCAVVLLVTHAQTGLTVSCIGVFISIVTLIAAGKDALKLIKQIDYKTLLFFIGLFMVVGGLEQTGILKVMANFIGDISNGNLMLMIAIILWISAIASAFVDNIPFAATMIPIISSLSATQGVELSILAWALAMGTDIGGSATPIGASANVVGIATAAKAGHMIKWGKYCKVMAPATIIVVGISMLMIYARYL